MYNLRLGICRKQVIYHAQCDYPAVSHAVRIVGVIYEASKHGGARVATECGILLSGP